MGTLGMLECAAVLKNAKALSTLCRFQPTKGMPSIEMSGPSRKNFKPFWEVQLQVMLYLL